MKRFVAIFALLTAIAVPEITQAAMWDWVPKVMRFDNRYRGADITRYPGYECKFRNAWGDCVVYTYVHANRPAAGNTKNYGRRVTSPGNSNLNYSDCQYDDYLRETAPRTKYSNCDYGEVHPYRSGHRGY